MSIEVPAGHIHRADLITRGWSAALIGLHLPVFVKVDAPAGVSNKAYPSADVEAAEENIPAVRTAVRAAARTATELLEQMPRTGATYDYNNTLSRADLLARGWTATHIRRLLGDPDHTHGGYTVSLRWGLDRVTAAEAVDTRLQKRLATAREKRATEAALRRIEQAQREQVARDAAYLRAVEDGRRQAAVEAAREEEIRARMLTGAVLYRKYGESWALQGLGLKTGDAVEVTLKNGDIRRRVVGGILAVDGNIVTAHDAGAYVPPADNPVKGAVLLVDPGIGTVMRIGGLPAVVTAVRRRRVTDDDPSLYGSHLLGHEGGVAWWIRYRLATETEAGPLIERETDRLMDEIDRHR